jgi:mannosyltransferase
MKTLQLTIKRQHSLLIPITLFIFSMILYTINILHENIWYDEALVLFHADLPLLTLLEKVGFSASEAHPPLFHLIIKSLFLVFGESIFIGRFFSVILASSIVVLVYLFAKKHFTTKVALFSVVMLVFNPIMVSFAQELRMYMLTTFFTFLNLASFYYAMTLNKKHLWALYVITSILGLYTHYYFAFTFFCTIVFMILYISTRLGSRKLEKELLNRFFLSLILVLMAYLPWIPALMKQMSDMSQATWIEPARLITMYRLFCYFFSTKFSFDINPVVRATVPATISLIVLFYGAWYMIRKKRFDIQYIFIFTVFFTPLVFSLLFSVFLFSIINFRYFLPYYPWFVLLFAFGLSKIPYRIVQYGILGFMVIVISITTIGVLTNNFNGSAEQVAQYLNERVKDGEVIITFEESSFLTIHYYLDDKETIYYYTETPTIDAKGINTLPDRHLVGDELASVITKHNTFWLVPAPWTSESVDNLMITYPQYSINPDIEPVVFKHRYSWARNKVIHMIKR